MGTLQETLEAASSFIWGPFLLLPLLIGTGVFLTARLGLIQLRLFTKAMSLQFGRRSRQEGAKGEISSFQAMSTALGATVGTGNIVGVALSLSIGGPGALFWMWATAIFGMASKYAECFLGVRFRHRDKMAPRPTCNEVSPTASENSSPPCLPSAVSSPASASAT